MSDAEIAALQREYPASWRSMLPRGVQVPADAKPAPPAEAKPAEKPADDTKPAESAKEPADPTKTAPPENAEVRAWAERSGVSPDAVPVFEKAVAERTAEIESWRKEVLADPEIGSSQALTRVREVAKAYGDAAFFEIMDSTGLGNHPAVIRLLARIARELDSR